jgi:hypothetical protein
VQPSAISITPIINNDDFGEKSVSGRPLKTNASMFAGEAAPSLPPAKSATMVAAASFSHQPVNGYVMLHGQIVIRWVLLRRRLEVLLLLVTLAQ